MVLALSNPSCSSLPHRPPPAPRADLIPATSNVARELIEIPLSNMHVYVYINLKNKFKKKKKHNYTLIDLSYLSYLDIPGNLA